MITNDRAIQKVSQHLRLVTLLPIPQSPDDPDCVFIQATGSSGDPDCVFIQATGQTRVKAHRAYVFMDVWEFTEAVVVQNHLPSIIKVMVDVGFGIKVERWIHLLGVDDKSRPSDNLEGKRLTSEWLTEHERVRLYVHHAAGSETWHGMITAQDDPEVCLNNHLMTHGFMG